MKESSVTNTADPPCIFCGIELNHLDRKRLTGDQFVVHEGCWLSAFKGSHTGDLRHIIGDRN